MGNAFVSMQCQYRKRLKSGKFSLSRSGGGEWCRRERKRNRGNIACGALGCSMLWFRIPYLYDVVWWMYENEGIVLKHYFVSVKARGDLPQRE